MPAVLISGGSRGIGAACVRAFARAGWQVAFSYLHSREDAERLTREFPQVLAVCADMRKREDVKTCVNEVTSRFSSLQALVCNAGIAQQKMFCDLTDEDWSNMLQSNLLSAVYLIQAVLPQMVHLKKGSIVTVSSMWGMTGASCESHYAASKGALIALSKSLASELGPSGIRINSVAPGVIDTDMNALHTEETMQELADCAALHRVGTPEEIAETIRFLCSDAASYLTGQVIPVTGGFEE